MNIGKRILLCLHWLISVICVASIVLKTKTEQLVTLIQESIGVRYAHIAFIAGVAVYAFLSIVCLIAIVKRDHKRGERGFITMDSSENGKVRIAVSAVEQMIRRAIENVDGLAETKLAISNQDDALNVTVKAVLADGAHVPTVTLNIQRAIRQYVEMNCGVAVCTVSVNVQSISNTVQAAKPSASVRPDDVNPSEVHVPSLKLEPQESEKVEAAEAETAVDPDAAQVEENPSEEEPQHGSEEM